MRSARFFNFYWSCFTYTWYNQSFRFTRHFYHHINSNRIPLNLPNILSKLKLQTHVGLAPVVFESDMKRNIKFLETSLSQPMYFFSSFFPKKRKEKSHRSKSLSQRILFCSVLSSFLEVFEIRLMFTFSYFNYIYMFPYGKSPKFLLAFSLATKSKMNFLVQLSFLFIFFKNS